MLSPDAVSHVFYYYNVFLCLLDDGACALIICQIITNLHAVRMFRWHWSRLKVTSILHDGREVRLNLEK